MRYSLTTVTPLALILSGACILCGCTRNSAVEKNPSADTQAAARAARSCEQQMVDLKKWARTIVEPPRLDTSVTYISRRAVAATELPYVQTYGNTIVVDEQTVHLNGQEVATAQMARSGKWGALIEALKKNEQNRRAVHPGEQHEVKIFLAVDKDHTWATVVSLVKAVQTHGIKKIGFLFHTPDPTPPMPTGSTHDKELKELIGELDAAIDPAGKAVMLRHSSEDTPVKRLWRAATRSCPKVLKALAAAAGNDQLEKNEKILHGVGASLLNCGCNADIPLIRGLLYLQLRAKPTAVAWVTVGAEGDRLVRPAGEPWSMAHRAIIEASKKQRAQQKRVPLVLDSAL